MANDIPFMKINFTEKELYYLNQALESGQLAGNGQFSKKCNKWIEDYTGCLKSLLVTSCTSALEMSARLLDIKLNDEIIMPSFTFVSTANAFALFGATPVFVDIDPDTLNLDEKLIEKVITPRTKAIVPVHYAGVSCEMDTIMEIAHKYNLVVIEDAAQGIGSKYKNKSLGTIGHMAAISFHQTKNVTSGGEGGALLINDPKYIDRAEIIIEKGTNRKQFYQGLVDKYTWVEIGSSYVMSDLLAAFLYGQLERFETIQQSRLEQWNLYNTSFQALEREGLIKTPVIPPLLEHNAHIFYMLLNSEEQRNGLLSYLQSKGIGAVFHYIPLHDSPGGKKYGRIGTAMTNTEDLSRRLIRLPIWEGLNSSQQEHIIGEVYNFFGRS